LKKQEKQNNLLRSTSYTDKYLDFALEESEEDYPSGRDEMDLSIETMITDESDIGKRLDVYLSERMGLTRSFIQKLIDKGNVTVSSRSKVKASMKVKPSWKISVILTPAQELDVVPEPVPFSVVYEDHHILVVNKPAGIVVHPAPGNWHGTLVHGLLYRYPDIGTINNIVRPGIVHRLDAMTSGLMVIARTSIAMERLQWQFKNREIRKEYLALVKGVPAQAEGRLDLPIARNPRNRLKMSVRHNGKPSVTEYRVLWNNEKYKVSLILCNLLTGRTHQIRVHMKHLGCPLIGDPLYGPRKAPEPLLGRTFLHSWKLEFRHPVTKKALSFTEPLPDELIIFLGKILSSKQGPQVSKRDFDS